MNLPCCPVLSPQILGGITADPLETWKRSTLHWLASEFATPAPKGCPFSILTTLITLVDGPVIWNLSKSRRSWKTWNISNCLVLQVNWVDIRLIAMTRCGDDSPPWCTVIKECSQKVLFYVVSWTKRNNTLIKVFKIIFPFFMRQPTTMPSIEQLIALINDSMNLLPSTKKRGLLKYTSVTSTVLGRLHSIKTHLISLFST